jgi:ppGpp synthetase/RelA/SpoT-type nucleotidyltranferase
MPLSLDQARQAWIKDEPTYGALGAVLHERLMHAIRDLGISAQVTYRTKTIDSLVRKLWLKKHHTYESLPDKLGVRVIVRYQHETDAIITALRTRLDCQDVDTKADALEPDQVGYRATHLQIRLLADDPAATTYTPAQYIAELQVQTLAQHLWADMSHDVFYKNQQSTDPQLQRRIYLLAGLIEVADNEFSRIEADVARMPELRNVLILRALERQYYKLAAQPGNIALSLQVIEHLAPLYGDTPGDWARRFEELFRDKETVLRAVFVTLAARPDQRSAFFFQPEVLMIYDRLLHDQYRLRETWNTTFPEDELERIANVFGFSFD